MTRSPESYLASSPTYMCRLLLVNTSPTPSSLSPIVTKSHSSYTSSTCCVRRAPRFHTKKRNPLLGTNRGGFFSEDVKTVLSDDFLWGHFSDLLVQKMQVREFQPVGHVQLPAEHEILRDFPHFEGRSFFFPLTLKTTTSKDQHRQNQFLDSYHLTYALQWRSL